MHDDQENPDFLGMDADQLEAAEPEEAAEGTDAEREEGAEVNAGPEDATQPARSDEFGNLGEERKQQCKRSANGDLKKLFAAAAARPLAASSASSARVQLDILASPDGGAKADAAPDEAIPVTQTEPSPAPAARNLGAAGGRVLLSAFKLSVSALQEVSEAYLAPPPPLDVGTTFPRLETSVLVAPVALNALKEAVPLLKASVPLLPSGKAIFKQLPAQWLDVSGRSDAMGTRCLFASRRHEHSVFEPLPPEGLLEVPQAAREWQLPMTVPADIVTDADSLGKDDSWIVQLHPDGPAVRVLVRPGALLLAMLRKGTALPAARFAWRITDKVRCRDTTLGNSAERPLATALGEFSILSNLEDAACPQPPRFQEYPLRREQLRSLGWMLAQERRRREPFVAELRDWASCPDAAHWRLEGSLRCEYTGVKGGVLADAIGYGKTACTIGLIDCTKDDIPPQVPSAYTGFLPTRATLILAPTNLHAQWLAEITKFTGDTLKVLSVPTCAQLKRLSLRDIAEADVVVATYRLFYSSPYLKRLEELARYRRPGFAFPKQSGFNTASCEWSRAYRTAFEALPAWAAKVQAPEQRSEDPATPAKTSLARRNAGDDTVPTGPSQSEPRRRRSKPESPPAKQVEFFETQATQPYFPGTQCSQPVKRRRVIGKQRDAEWMSQQISQAADKREEASKAPIPEASAAVQYVPLEAFWWRRVVCDEFHELLSRYPPAQVAVELFHAEYKWGLSGTPPCQTLAQIRKAAGFLGVQLPSSEITDGDSDEPRKVAQEWLDAFVRRNTAELPALEEEEQIIPVRQTPKERALYVALTEQHFSGIQEAAGDNLQALQELRDASTSASGLLKLCSHFSTSSGVADVLTAADECERQLAMRREQARASEREISSLAERAGSTVQLIQHFEPFFGREPNASNCSYISKETRPALLARLKFLGASTAGSKAEVLNRVFSTAASAPSSLAKERALQPAFDARDAGKASNLPKDIEEAGGKNPAWLQLIEQCSNQEDLPRDPKLDAGRKLVMKAVRATLQSSGSSAPLRCTRMRTSLGMPKWPGSQEEGSEARHELEVANRDWLKEKANFDKLQKVIIAWKIDVQRCALRLQDLQTEVSEKLQSVRSFQDTLHASQLQALPEDLELEHPGSKFAKYGSKIEALVKHVKKIQANDAGCKLICFVQWEDLKRKIGSALKEFGVEHLSLQGSVWARRSALMRFQYELDSPKMLLLSLEESASGTNLTAANHVLIVHPMEASTKEEAVAFEMQAVGRVRRPGQQRRIHIWRFVTMETIEQEITEEHQKELWERQQVKVLVTQPEPAQANRDSDVEMDDDIPVAQPEADTNASTQPYFPTSFAAASSGHVTDASLDPDATQRF